MSVGHYEYVYCYPKYDEYFLGGGGGVTRTVLFPLKVVTAEKCYGVDMSGSTKKNTKVEVPTEFLC